MNTKPKANLKLRIKRKHKSGHSLTFLRHKRALSVIKEKSKSKKNNWDIQLKNINGISFFYDFWFNDNFRNINSNIIS